MIDRILWLIDNGLSITGFIHVWVANIQMLDALVALGVDVNERTKYGDMTPLMTIINSRRIKPWIKVNRIHYLLHHGANPWLKDKDGDDVWDNALGVWKHNQQTGERNDPSVIVFLVRRGIMRGKLSELPKHVRNVIWAEMVMMTLCIPASKGREKDGWLNRDLLKSLYGYLVINHTL